MNPSTPTQPTPTPERPGIGAALRRFVATAGPRRIRRWSAAMVVMLVILAYVLPGRSATLEIYKRASCGCCRKWVQHMEAAGFTVVVHDVHDVQTIRESLGMPGKFAGCHTAKIGRYVVDGHVPAADVRRLLRDRPRAVGLAVPGMPSGSPGMESVTPQPYETLLVAADGTASVFAQH